MRRVRWLKATWSLSMRQLAEKLKNMPYLEGNMNGFIIERVRDSLIEGKYIEKNIFQEITIDPLGRDNVVDRTSFSVTQFSLFSEFPFVELINPPKSIKGFLNKLLEACSFNLVIQPIKVDLFHWINSIQEKIEMKFIIDSLQISDMKFGEGVSGKMLIKGNKDVRKVACEILDGKIYKLEKIQLRFDRDIVVYLTNSASIKLSSKCSNDIFSIIKQTIPSDNTSIDFNNGIE